MPKILTEKRRPHILTPMKLTNCLYSAYHYYAGSPFMDAIGGV